MLPDIRSQTRETLATQFAAWGQPAYRLDQLLGWLYARRAVSWDAMTNLSKSLRAQLAETWSLRLPELVVKQGSSDTTQKFLWRLADGALIESVLIPANPGLYGDASDRLDQHEVVTTLRREKGHDIDAACGQLRLKTEAKESEVA